MNPSYFKPLPSNHLTSFLYATPIFHSPIHFSLIKSYPVLPEQVKSAENCFYVHFGEFINVLHVSVFILSWFYALLIM